MNVFRDTYSELNKQLFSGRLPEPEFRYATNRKGIFSFVRPNVIQIGGEVCQATPVEALDELVHVMVHILNHLDGVVDHTQNQYHNANFRDTALAMGLVVGCHKSRGWGVTSSDEQRIDCMKLATPCDAARQRLAKAYKTVRDVANFSDASFEAVRGDAIRLVESKPAKKQFLLRYTCKCPPPHNSIRSGRRPDGSNPLHAKCLTCGAKFCLSDR